MTTLFTTGSAAQNETYDLMMEYGPDYCAYGYWNAGKQSFAAITYFSFQPFEDSTAIDGIVNGLKGNNFNRVILSSGYHAALLLPQRFGSKGEALVAAVYNEKAVHYLQDKVPAWQLEVGYVLPGQVYHSFSAAYPASGFMHAYTAAIKAGYASATSIDICFSPARFRVLLKKNSVIQLAQTYNYTSPLDVIYFLLKICYEFGLDQKEVEIVVSGLIDQDSALYKELYSYFLHLQFAHTGVSIPGDGLPPHYFASLHNMAVCAS